MHLERQIAFFLNNGCRLKTTPFAGKDFFTCSDLSDHTGTYTGIADTVDNFIKKLLSKLFNTFFKRCLGMGIPRVPAAAGDNMQT